MEHLASSNGYKNSYRQSQTHPRYKIRNQVIHIRYYIVVFLKKTAPIRIPKIQAKRPVLFSCIEAFSFKSAWSGFAWHKEWEIREKAETELTEILYSVLHHEIVELLSIRNWHTVESTLLYDTIFLLLWNYTSPPTECFVDSKAMSFPVFVLFGDSLTHLFP